MEKMKKDLETLCDTLNGDASIYIKDINTNKSIAIRSREKFNVASVIKMWLLWLFLLEEQKGKYDLNQKTKLVFDKTVSNMGITDLVSSDIEWTYKDILTMMIVLSDNHCTNYIVDLLGIENINKEMKRLNVINTVFNKKMNAGNANWSTAEDISNIFELFFTSPELSEKNRELALSMLLNQKSHTKLPFSFRVKILTDGKENKFYHKTGEVLFSEVDAGVLYLPKIDKKIIIVCMTKNLQENNDGVKFCSEVGEIVYNLYNN